jgi:hypothetical protein
MIDGWERREKRRWRAWGKLQKISMRPHVEMHGAHRSRAEVVRAKPNSASRPRRLSGHRKSWNFNTGPDLFLRKSPSLIGYHRVQWTCLLWMLSMTPCFAEDDMIFRKPLYVAIQRNRSRNAMPHFQSSMSIATILIVELDTASTPELSRYS